MVLLNKERVVKTSSSLFAVTGFAVVAGLVVWASMSRETLPTDSVFDPPATEASVADSSATPVEPADAVTDPVAQTQTADPMERTVHALRDEVAVVGKPSTSKSEGDPIAQAEQAIARADAALAAAGMSTRPATRPPDTPRSERLADLQARLDQLPRQ